LVHMLPSFTFSFFSSSTKLKSGIMLRIIFSVSLYFWV
jgi:hypothetical protein